MNESGIRPLEYRVLVKPIKVEEKTEGGIVLPESVQEKDKYAVMKGELVAFGELAFTDPDWLDKPKVGNMVLYDRYGGSTVKGRDDEEYRLMNDKEIGGVYE